MKKNESKRVHAIKSVKFYEMVDNLIEQVQSEISWLGITETTEDTAPFSYEYNRNLEKQAMQDLITILKEIDY